MVERDCPARKDTKKYLKWILCLESRTSNYILYEEVRHDNTMKESDENAIVKHSLKEKRRGKGDEERLDERQRYLNNCGWTSNME